MVHKFQVQGGPGKPDRRGIINLYSRNTFCLMCQVEIGIIECGFVYELLARHWCLPKF
jgi:hypothetical protein